MFDTGTLLVCVLEIGSARKEVFVRTHKNEDV